MNTTNQIIINADYLGIIKSTIYGNNVMEYVKPGE